MKPKVFVGSSKESLNIAKAVQENLEYDADVTIWSQDSFQLSTYALDSLIEVLNKVDFGIFILGLDDVVMLRGKEYKSPRDNIILELGLSIGSLGKAKTFIIHPRDIDDLRLPTDLLGLTPALFDNNRQDQNLSAALGPACNKITSAMKKLNEVQKETEIELLGKFERVLYLTLAEIADSTGVRSEDIGIHLWVVEQVEGISSPVLARKVRARLSGVTPSPTRYWKKGEGIVGQCWKSQSDVWVDLTDSKYQNISDHDWNNLVADERIGLSYDEFLKTIQYFNSIFAIPIVSKDKFIGCISMNIERESIVPFNSIWTDDVKRILRRSSAFLEILLR